MKAAPEKILISVILSVSVIAFAAAYAYVFFSDEGEKEPSTDETVENEGTVEVIGAEETEPPEASFEENSVEFPYPANRSGDDGAVVPDVIISFFSYLDGGDYDRLPTLCIRPASWAIQEALADERAREQKSGIFSVKKARLLSAEEFVWAGASYWRCRVDVEYFDGREEDEYFFVELSLYGKDRICFIGRGYQPEVEAQ